MRLDWGLGPRPFDQGLERGVLYLSDDAVPWNGLVSVDEEASASVESTTYYDGNAAQIAVEVSDFKATVQAYTYPDAFAEYNGYGPVEAYARFGLTYRTERGDGYFLHLVYNALIDPKDMRWTTLSKTLDPSMFAWNVVTSAIPVPGARPTSHIVIDSEAFPYLTAEIEDLLYGTDTTDPYLPSPAELVAMFEAATSLRITNHGDGTYTASGDDRLLQLGPDGTFSVNAPSVYPQPAGRFTVSSY